MIHSAELLLGMALGGLIACCFCYPRVGRAVGKLFATLGVTCGVGLLVWGICGASAEDFQPMQSGPLVFTSPSQAIGWGSGILAGGLTALVLSLVGGRAVD